VGLGDGSELFECHYYHWLVRLEKTLEIWIRYMHAGLPKHSIITTPPELTKRTLPSCQTYSPCKIYFRLIRGELENYVMVGQQFFVSVYHCEVLATFPHTPRISASSVRTQVPTTAYLLPYNKAYLSP